MVSDNASNIVSAVKNQLKWHHFGCFAHTLNLIVQDAMKSDTISKLLEKAKRIVVSLKDRPLQMKKLISFQINAGKKVPLKLIQEVHTRWNSTLYMVQRFVELHDAVKTSVALVDNDVPTLSAEEWQICREMTEVLLPIEDVTKKLSGEQYPTGSQVIGLTRGLVSVYGQMMKDKFHSSAMKIVVGTNQDFSLVSIT